ncbi:hypothetical protein A3A67_01860 [Candidatus Peribacteria bacterium RIFCSPLOWO2_01_FULL_51_18]|nr:MAG: hypothetical protein A3C52_05280 [Candidatus Peribacteria bacterium RIFCSPHIGHO2_02_FULL_51_15]OGJ66324.1 MAG: hypothetical protein A3A67_01860 [Candidatus Peribacteria bacterium RIFCSPLOWO2_01_FULL_51_18]OGJ68527.1 MAG: hypothetical protein A3J34_05095 [Candidatus Peribacteria bacterium RIFCSPLOWO2_02_FULL_51_10]
MKKTLIRGGKIVSSSGTIETDVLISVNKEIEELKPKINPPKNAEVIEAAGRLIYPLLIDCHVHFREPGMEYKATMESESAAALNGGIGTVCEMPNTIPPTVTVVALADKVRRAAKIDGLNIKFFFGVTEPAHLQELRNLWTGDSLEHRRLRRHCPGVKLFMDHSTGDLRAEGDVIASVFETCAELKIPLVAHCEDPETNAEAKKSVTATDIGAHALLRPPESEVRALEKALAFTAKYSVSLHIAHLSTREGAELVRSAKNDGLKVTCEVTPHHLFFTSDDYSDLGTFIKVNPAIAGVEHRDALWQAVLDGTVDCIASDHAPHTLQEKRNTEPLKAPSGIPGMELMLPLLLTAAAGRWPHPRSKPPPAFGLKYQDIFRLCFENPNRIFGLGCEAIQKTKPARLIIVDPKKEFTVTPVALHGKSGWTPYEAWQLTGKVESVFQ